MVGRSCVEYGLRALTGILIFACAAAAWPQSFENTQAALLKETDVLLQQVERGVLDELEREASRVEEDGAKALDAAIASTGRETLDNIAEEQMRAERDELLRRVNDWAQADAVLLDVLETNELSDALARATAIARYHGLDVVRLQRLYDLGKRTIRRSSFVVHDRIPPDQDESVARYFKNFFVFAALRETELADYYRRNQTYRVRLYKRVTLAYLRALLASAESFPTCEVSKPTATQVNGKDVQTLECRDPVVAGLRSYVKGVQSISSAEADAFAAEAEKLIAEQTLVSDMAAGLPVVGEFLDFYSIYSGEDLAGNCLDRFSYALTVVFSVIPFLPDSWVEQIVKRLGIEDAIAKLLVWGAGLAEWAPTALEGFAARVGLTAQQLEAVQRGLDTGIEAVTQVLNTRVDVTTDPIRFPGIGGDLSGGGITQSKKLGELTAETTKQKIAMAIMKNTQLAEEGQRMMRMLPDAVRERMEALSKRIMGTNLLSIPANAKALRGDASEVIEQSNMVKKHLDAFLEVAEEDDAILIFRAVNPDATRLIDENYATKWMDVKGKSSDWGPQSGFIPVEQKFSKLNNPSKTMDADALAEVAGFHEKVDKCLQKGICFKIDLELSNGDHVHVWKNGDAELPILKGPDGRFRDPDTGDLLNIDPATTRPMEVLAGPNKAGELVPLTADYDFLAMGTGRNQSLDVKLTDDVRLPDNDPKRGAATAKERKLVERVNKAGEKAGYKGGNLSHHGAENQYFDSPGALSVDPSVTVIDPEKGLLTIPRCELECMKKWCEKSKQCGSLPICGADSPQAPCIHIDPDRLLKDYFHEARLRGYDNLRPNSIWGWGEFNGLSGWTPMVVMDPKGPKPADWVMGQYRPEMGMRSTVLSTGSSALTSSARSAAKRALRYLFECPAK